jgi:hypothetical protein
MAHGIVCVDDQWIFANPLLGALVFFGYIRCSNGQEKVLIEFPFTKKDTKDQEFRSRGKYSTRARFVAVVVFDLAALPGRILCDSEGISNDVRAKDCFLRQHAKIMRVRHFSEHSNVSSKFRT